VSRRDELARNLVDVEERIAAACRAAGRARSEVTLVVVTKTWPVSDARLLRELGVTELAENRDREAREKAAAVPGARWHFVGSLQTNKARSVASYADVVESVDRPALVDALSAGAQRAGRELAVLLQVSLDGDPARGGALPEVLPALADQVTRAPALRLRGLMAVAPLGADPAEAFGRLHALHLQLRAAHPDATVLSAGMSGDLEAAIRAGATHVRVGTAVLGPRGGPLR
jgi:pyridoxal phosphate enzyme (YggS family)